MRWAWFDFMNLQSIKMLILDVDGVLTNGEIILDDRGVQAKIFNVHDGAGIRYLIQSGIRVALVTGRNSRAVKHRAKELGVTDVYQGVKDKTRVFKKIKQRHHLKDSEICCAGDDLLDIPLMKRVGYAVAVKNARPEVKRYADYITRQSGGEGAVREMAEKILKAQKKWAKILKRYQGKQQD